MAQCPRCSIKKFLLISMAPPTAVSDTLPTKFHTTLHMSHAPLNFFLAFLLDLVFRDLISIAAFKIPKFIKNLRVEL